MDIFITVIRDSLLDYDEYKILSGFYYTNYGMAEAEADEYNSMVNPEYPAEVVTLVSRVDEAIEYARAMFKNGGEMYVDDSFTFDTWEAAAAGTTIKRGPHSTPYNGVVSRNRVEWEISDQQG